MKNVLLIDNYDSFTFNLVQYFQELGANVIVRKNDAITVSEAEDLKIDALVFSPGPGTVECAEDIGNGLAIFEHFKGKIPILGVCLGHQMMGKYFGGSIEKIAPMHGKKSTIIITNKEGLFQGLPDTIEGMRYHSLIVTQSNIDITATTEDGHIMALEDSAERIFGIQFHPESIGTRAGIHILKNFLSFT
jgi:anthranilate synthase/aminodeoxychorismate synthase-like glutamine amidotransferase